MRRAAPLPIIRAVRTFTSDFRRLENESHFCLGRVLYVHKNINEISYSVFWWMDVGKWFDGRFALVEGRQTATFFELSVRTIRKPELCFRLGIFSIFRLNFQMFYQKCIYSKPKIAWRNITQQVGEIYSMVCGWLRITKSTLCSVLYSFLCFFIH